MTGRSVSDFDAGTAAIFGLRAYAGTHRIRRDSAKREKSKPYRGGNTCRRGDYAGKASTIPAWKAWKYLPEREIHKKGK